MNECFVVAGAAANTGRAVAETLIAQGHRVRVLGRSPSRLAALAERGAEVATGALTDPDFLTRAFEGATGVYTLIPYDYGALDLHAHQSAIIDANATAIERAEVPYVVGLTSFGAHLATDSGVLEGLNAFERSLQRLAEVSGRHTVALRAGFFFQNFLGMINTVRSMGVLGGFPIRGDIAIPMTSTVDVGRKAAELLAARRFRGFSVAEVAGPRDLSLAEAALILGQSVGKPELPWVQFPYADAEQSMVAHGFSPSVASGFVQFAKRANDGSIWGSYRRTADNTTASTLESFAAQFATGYRAALAAEPSAP